MPQTGIPDQAALDRLSISIEHLTSLLEQVLDGRLAETSEPIERIIAEIGGIADALAMSLRAQTRMGEDIQELRQSPKREHEIERLHQRLDAPHAPNPPMQEMQGSRLGDGIGGGSEAGSR